MLRGPRSIVVLLFFPIFIFIFITKQHFLLESLVPTFLFPDCSNKKRNMGVFSATRQIFKSSKTIYNNFLIRKPYLAQAIQVSVLMGAGDVLAQTIVEKKLIKQINIYRTLQFSGLGFCFIGPCLRLWYGQLERICKFPKQRWKVVISKVGLDQLLFAPIFLGIITSIISFLQGMDLENVTKRLKNEYWSILQANYCIWPAAQLINFAVIPLNFQVLFVQIVAIVWNTYLSVKLNQ